MIPHTTVMERILDERDAQRAASYTTNRKPAGLAQQPKLNTADVLAGQSLAQASSQAPGSTLLSSLLTAGLSAYCAYKGAEIGAKAGAKIATEKKMESNRMKRTADARSMSKKNLVFAFVQLGHDYDKMIDEIKDLRARLTSESALLAAHENCAKVMGDRSRALTRAQQTIRLMRQLIAHSFDEGGS